MNPLFCILEKIFFPKKKYSSECCPYIFTIYLLIPQNFQSHIFVNIPIKLERTVYINSKSKTQKYDNWQQHPR